MGKAGLFFFSFEKCSPLKTNRKALLITREIKLKAQREKQRQTRIFVGNTHRS